MEYEKRQLEELPCQNCGIHAPKKQLKNLNGKCERCYLKKKKQIKQSQPKNNPKTNLIAKWKLDTPGVSL